VVLAHPKPQQVLAGATQVDSQRPLLGLQVSQMGKSQSTGTMLPQLPPSQSPTRHKLSGAWHGSSSALGVQSEALALTSQSSQSFSGFAWTSAKHSRSIRHPVGQKGPAVVVVDVVVVVGEVVVGASVVVVVVAQASDGEQVPDVWSVNPTQQPLQHWSLLAQPTSTTTGSMQPQMPIAMQPSSPSQQCASMLQ
jgi:hypothetical protein